MNYTYRKVTDHKVGNSATIVVLCDDEQLGEGTLLSSPNCDVIAGRLVLCNNRSIANVNTLRIHKSHEGQGHMTKLI